MSDACDWCERFRPHGLAVYTLLDARVLLCLVCKERADAALERAFDAAQAETREEHERADDAFEADVLADEEAREEEP